MPNTSREMSLLWRWMMRGTPLLYSNTGWKIFKNRRIRCQGANDDKEDAAADVFVGGGPLLPTLIVHTFVRIQQRVTQSRKGGARSGVYQVQDHFLHGFRDV